MSDPVYIFKIDFHASGVCTEVAAFDDHRSGYTSGIRIKFCNLNRLVWVEPAASIDVVI